MAEIKKLTNDDIDNIDKLFIQEGLTARCYRINPRLDKYECIVKSDDEKIAYVEFEIHDKNRAYIDFLKNEYDIQENRYSKGKQKHIYIVGSHILFKAIRKAKKLGAKFVYLLPLDTSKDAKLFKYYKKLGFECSFDAETLTNFPQHDTHTIQEWYENCQYMIGNIDTILSKCCKNIPYKR